MRAAASPLRAAHPFQVEAVGLRTLIVFGQCGVSRKPARRPSRIIASRPTNCADRLIRTGFDCAAEGPGAAMPVLRSEQSARTSSISMAQRVSPCSRISTDFRWRSAVRSTRRSIRVGEFRDRLRRRRKVAGKAHTGSRPQPLSAKGQPESKTSIWKVGRYLAP